MFGQAFHNVLHATHPDRPQHRRRIDGPSLVIRNDADGNYR
jgi:hypothetical protein